MLADDRQTVKLSEDALGLGEGMRVRFSCGALIVMLTLTVSGAHAGRASSDFRFETVASIDDMRHILSDRFPPGSPRIEVRKLFVTQGQATLKLHPTQAGVEKYLYDINLCGYYVWRWNISADYDAKGLLVQTYVNGEPVFSSGKQKKDPAQFKKGHQSIYKMKRLRPEASKGEKELSYIVLDADSDQTTIDDQVAMGGGPTRADPVNMGTLHGYTNVEPWRSIFDQDSAGPPRPYAGDCKAADELYLRQKPPVQ
jgi:hypothetical protein